MGAPEAPEASKAWFVGFLAAAAVEVAAGEQEKARVKAAAEEVKGMVAAAEEGWGEEGKASAARAVATSEVATAAVAPAEAERVPED